MDNYIQHHGIEGQKWGIKNGPPYPLNRTETYEKCKNVYDFCKKINYSDFSKLQTPLETEQTGKGSCHDQVMYELKLCKKYGLDADARFVMEVDPKTGQGGDTHSYVFIKDGDRIHWIENAFEGEKGVHTFKNTDEIDKYFTKQHKGKRFGNNSSYPELIFSDFKPTKHKYGESLQELVDICLED